MKKLGSENQQKWSYSPLEILKHWKITTKRRVLNTNIRPACWKYFRCQSHIYAFFVQCRPGFHMLSIKKHSYTLFWLKSGRRETIKTRKQKEKENSSFLFCSQETSCLKNQHKGRPQFLLKTGCKIRVFKRSDIVQ